jgi:hypothetical protein
MVRMASGLAERTGGTLRPRWIVRVGAPQASKPLARRTQSTTEDHGAVRPGRPPVSRRYFAGSIGPAPSAAHDFVCIRGPGTVRLRDISMVRVLAAGVVCIDVATTAARSALYPSPWRSVVLRVLRVKTLLAYVSRGQRNVRPRPPVLWWSDRNRDKGRPSTHPDPQRKAFDEPTLSPNHPCRPLTRGRR